MFSRLRKLAITIRKWIVSLEPTSKFSKIIIVSSYKTVLIVFRKYKRRKRSIFRIMKNNMSEVDFSDNRKVKNTLNDILYCRFMYSTNAREYFTYDFEKLSHEGRKTYITRGNKYHFYRKFNNPNYMNYFNMKTESYRKFKKFYKRDILPIYNEEDYLSFLEFIKKHNRFIYKPSNDYGGQGIKIYKVDDYENYEDLFKIIVYNGYCVIEELIVQPAEFAKVHPSSVNTVRIVSYSKDNGDIVFQWAFFRMGMGGNHTDNMSGGGLGAMIDRDTGIIYSVGSDYLGKRHIYHPDSGVQLIGYQMPEWDELKKIVREISMVIPEVKLVGWDFAYSIRGWDLVEANSRPQTLTAQISNHSGRLHQFIELENIYDEEVIQHV